MVPNKRFPQLRLESLKSLPIPKIAPMHAKVGFRSKNAYKKAHKVAAIAVLIFLIPT